MRSRCAWLPPKRWAMPRSGRSSSTVRVGAPSTRARIALHSGAPTSRVNMALSPPSCSTRAWAASTAWIASPRWAQAKAIIAWASLKA
ncbi:hypothetical protein D3C81_1578870 [compost metagenome]